MLERNLQAVDALDRIGGNKGALGDGRKRLFGVPGAVVAGASLVGAVLRVGGIVAQVGQQQHRRARQMGFNRAEAGVQQEGGLADGHARFAGQTAVGLGHHPGACLFADEHRPDRVPVVVQGVKQRSGIAARNTEDHIDPGLFKDADNGLTWRNGLVNKRLCHTAFSLVVRTFRFACQL